MVNLVPAKLFAAVLMTLIQFGATHNNQVAVAKIGEGGFIFKCSGALISSNEVLTTCSCVSSVVTDIETSVSKLVPHRAKDIMIIVGTSLKVKDKYRSRVSFLNLHPQCNMEYDNDLAVLHTVDQFSSNDAFIAKIPSESSIQAMISSQNCVTSAWGISQNVDENKDDEKEHTPLSKINVKFDKSENCNQLVCAVDVNAVCDPDLSDYQCLQSTDGTPICSADSGSPVFCDGVLVGVTSLQKVIDSNCDDEKLSRHSLVVPLSGSLDFIKKSHTMTKPTTVKVKWAPAKGEPSIVEKRKSKHGGRSMEDPNENTPPNHEEREPESREGARAASFSSRLGASILIYSSIYISMFPLQ